MMKTAVIITYILLIFLTILSGLIASSPFSLLPRVSLLLLCCVCKFLLVAFQFMELKKAHSFWKYTLILFVILLFGLIIMIKIT